MTDYERTVKVFQQKDEWIGGHFQGDILLQDNKIPKVSCFNAVCSKDQLWKDATLYYCIHEKSYNTEQIEQIQEAAKEIMDKTGCIHLFRVSESSKDDYVLIKPDGNGCASHVGKVGGAQPLTLTHKSLFNTGTVMHEFLHALGLHHEHIREDRDSYITVHWEHINEDNWKNFSKVNNTMISHYDYESLLHWGPAVFSDESNKQDTITVKKSKRIGSREKLSEMDIEKLQVLYGHVQPRETKYFTTFKKEDLFQPAEWVHKTPSPKKSS